ncbi:C-factor [Synechococcus sp. MIT S9509]|uniref:SDR family NAD(P)-dependent oxidoreductase n=1 Tax=unclassified Synechococcus TaxID=2626047 RepID=UPI0007BB6E15|nr:MULTISPECIES: SDR family NAD(P)-dependent oxidoreductase [unclassified Synechococcus]KZR88019.1 C-factor [Synechococcus sp. MIT S9504]KZR92196.1 C-factor [Synechococcus sp. MIT S9509]
MPEICSESWQGRALVVGGGGIGRALSSELARRQPSLLVTLATRQPLSDREWSVDLQSPDSLSQLTEQLSDDPHPLRVVINATGRLHSPSYQPEKRLQHAEQSALLDSFAINAAGPLLLAKSVEPVLNRDTPFHFASLSARVGSIGDNRSGGWYAYRGAKAAQNMMLRSLSLEWARRLPLATVTLLHPGTTDTALSKPFQSFVPKEKLFSPERAARHLVDVLMQQTPSDTGRFLAWDGQAIPW